MRRESKCVAMLLACVMLFSALFASVSLAAEETVLFENNFDFAAEGEKPNGLSATENAEKEALVRVVKDGDNGALCIFRQEGNTAGGSAGPRASLKVNLSKYEKLTIRFKAKADGATPSVGLYSANPQKTTIFLGVEEADWTEVVIEIDVEKLTYTATVGRQKTSGDIHAITDLVDCQIRFVATVEEPGTGAYYDDIKITAVGAEGAEQTEQESQASKTPPFEPTSLPNAPTIPQGAHVFMQTEFTDAALGKATSSTEKGMKIFSGGTSYTEIVDAGANRLMRYWAEDGLKHNPRTQVVLDPNVKHYSADYAVIPSNSIAHLTIYADGGQQNDMASISTKVDGVKANDWNYVHVDIDLEKLTLRASVNGKSLGEEKITSITDFTNAVLRFDSRLGGGDVIYWDAMAFYTTDEYIAKGPLLGNQKIKWEEVKPDKALSADSFVNNLTAHPRLLVHNWEEMRGKTDADFLSRKWYQNLKNSADQALKTPPTSRVVNSRGNVLESARSARDRLLALAFVYNIEGDRAYLDKAYEEMLAYGEWVDWSGFVSTLVTAEILSGYAYAYDWLHDDLSTEQRQKIIEIVKAKGLPDFIYCIEGQPSGTNFITTSVNWNPVCNASLIAWALAAADELPELSEYLLEKVPPAIQNALPPYAPQGGYPEGASYWSYGTTYAVIAGDFVEKAFVDGFELPESYIYWKAPGMADTADFGIYYDGPTGRFNYGDCGTGHTNCVVMYWAANRFNKPHYAWWENNRQIQLNSYMSGYSAVAALAWYDADNAYNTPGAFPLDKFYTSPDSVNGASMRSSWSDSTALFTALQGGNNKANHQHWSLGTYVIDYMGERFVRVLDHYDYALTGAKQTIYYKRAESYNTLVINPSAEPDQNASAVATLVDSGTSANTAFGILDMTATSDDYVSAKRGLMITDNRSRVIVQDEVKAKAPSEFYWFANSDASIKIAPDGKSALLTIGEESMLARIIEGPAEAKFALMDRVSLIDGVNNAIAATDGGKKLFIHLENKTELNLAVEYVALKQGEGIPAAWAYVPLAQWKAEENEMTTAAIAGSNVVLKLDTPNAIANGVKTFVDTQNTEVVPFTENSRTLVPVRFISESFGAKVGWDDATQTVLVNYEDKEIQLVIGSNEMKVNGETVVLDTPANTYNSRTLIPLRALVEALGKEVFWDDRGLIVISDAPVTYTEQQLAKLIRELNVRILVNGKDVAFFETDKTEYTIDINAGDAVAQLAATSIGSEEIAVMQANAIGESATVTVDGKVYTFTMQTDAFGGVLGHKDPGVITDLRVQLAGQTIPEYNTFIYVEDLADSTNWATYPVRGIVDGVINELVENRWASQGEGWISLDFGSLKNVHSMAFAGVSQDVRAYNFDVLASVDGVTWTTLHTGGAPATTEIMSIIPLGDVQARYVKLVGKGNNQNAWNTYAEVRFYESEAQQKEDMYYWPAYFGTVDLRGMVGTSAMLNVTGLDSTKTELDLKPTATVTFAVADPSIATIAADGSITFLKAGTTTVTVTVTQDGHSAVLKTNIMVD